MNIKKKTDDLKNLGDEYEIPYKKVLKQYIYEKKPDIKKFTDMNKELYKKFLKLIDRLPNEIIKAKTYGPFIVEYPIHLSIPDTYKLAMYTLFKKNSIYYRQTISLGSDANLLN